MNTQIDKKLNLLLGGEPKKTGLIRWFGNIITSVKNDKFIAKNKFTKNSKEVKFFGFFGSFEEEFLVGDGKIEYPLVEHNIRYGELVKSATDLPNKDGCAAIIPELGGEVKAEMSLSELYYLLRKHDDVENGGVFLADGRANILYIKNILGVLRAVRVSWRDVGWFIDVYGTDFPFGWDAGCRVFSRLM